MSEMRMHQETLEVATRGRGFTDLSGRVAEVVAHSRVQTGLCTVFVSHTSASLVIQENADRAVLRDLERWADEVAPESPKWEHDAEGRDDMPAHLRTTLTGPSSGIPIVDGKLALGVWQAVYLWEHRTAPHQRRVVVHVAGV